MIPPLPLPPRNDQWTQRWGEIRAYTLPSAIGSCRVDPCGGGLVHQHLFNNGERSDVHTRLPDKYQVYRSGRYSRPVSTG